MKKYLRLIFALTVVLCFWELLHIQSKGIGIPSVIVTLKNIGSIFPILLHHMYVSAVRLFAGLCIAFIIGSIIGYCMARFPMVDELLSPIVYLLTPLPKVAFLPIVMVILGISETARIAILVFVVVFQFIVGVRDALKTMPKTYVLSMRSLKLSRRSQLVDIMIPYAAPHLFTCLRQAFGMSIAVLFFVETFVNQQGIGYFIMNRWGVVNYPDMFSGIMVLSVFGYIVYALIDRVERKVCPWRYVDVSTAASERE